MRESAILRQPGKQGNKEMTETINGITWRFVVRGQNAIITGIPKDTSGDVDIPVRLGGAKVTYATYNAFHHRSKFQSVTIPDYLIATVDEPTNLSNSGLEPEMFDGCSSLREIRVSKRNPGYKSVNGILLSKGGEKVVAVPQGLAEAKIPKGVTKIGMSAFAGCRKLKNVALPDGVMKIEWHAFENCSALESITIPNSVRAIRQGAFRGCSKLKTVTIPSAAREIETDVFAGCGGLREIVVANGNSIYKSIDGLLVENDAKIRDDFSGARRKGYTLRAVPGGLTEVKIPDGVTYIDATAFMDCGKLKCVTIPSSVTGIGEKAFDGCRHLEGIAIPDGVTEIGNQAFTNCTGLKIVTIPAGLKKVGRFPFRKSNIENVTFLPGVKTIYNRMFAQCKIGSVTIPDSVTHIGTWAFEHCSGLTSVAIPKKVKSIGDYAFVSCTDLKSVTIPASLKAGAIGRNAFPEGVKIKRVK